MKKLFLLLILMLSVVTFAQSDLPEIGSLEDLKGKTRYYLNSPAKERKQILKELDTKKTGLELVSNPDDADFIVEYKVLDSKEKPFLISSSITSTTAQLDVYFYRDGKKIMAWSEGKTSSFRTEPYLALPRQLIKDLKKLK